MKDLNVITHPKKCMRKLFLTRKTYIKFFYILMKKAKRFLLHEIKLYLTGKKRPNLTALFRKIWCFQSKMKNIIQSHSVGIRIHNIFLRK